MRAPHIITLVAATASQSLVTIVCVFIVCSGREDNIQRQPRYECK